MSLLSEIELQILVLHSQEKSPRRVHVPVVRRAELERDMRRSQGVRPSDDLPLHIMGVLVCFDGDTVRFDDDSDIFHS